MALEMTSQHGARRRSTLALIIALVLAVAAVGATVYAFRGRLAAVPVIGGWFMNTEPARFTNRAGSEGAGATAPTIPTGTSDVEPRVEVNLDATRQQLIGVRTASVERTELAPMVRAVGAVRYDETRQSDVNLKLEGWIHDLYVNFTGQFVSKGQPLFTLYSPDLLTTQQEYLLALKTRDQLGQSAIADAREYADRLVDSARRRLALWDLPSEEMRTLEETREPRTTVVFRSPVSGHVIEKQAVEGMHVMPGQTLYKVADLSTVWVEADVYEQDMPRIQLGRPATVTLDAYPGEEFRGRAIYLYPFVEEKTRTMRVRFAFPNPRGRLKPGMYANVELQGRSGIGLTVPTNALLDSGRQQVVFVALGDGYFQPRQVKVGRRMAERVEILEGLKDGEQVATAATFFLDSESQLRAGLQSYDAPQTQRSSAGAAARRLDIGFRSQPDPPRTGDNTFEVTVKDPSGQPIADADVSVMFFMAAMPTMNMPAMRNETKLAPAGGGVYRGPGQVMMAGRWDATVTVTRGGARLGSRQFAVVAR